MLYPEKITAKKSGQIIKSLLLASVFVAIILIIINKLTTPNVPWAAVADAGIIYVWVTVLYAINKNSNIGKHVLIQTIAISVLVLFIDYKLNFVGWSVKILIPIIIIISNITMFCLTIISYKKYIKYAIYQLSIILLSLILTVLTFNNILPNSILVVIASAISIVNFVVSFILCSSDFQEVIKRKFHT